MDFKELKKLIGDSGRCVIIEDDKPAYVVMSAREFLALQENKALKPEVVGLVEEKTMSVAPPATKEVMAMLTEADEHPAVDLGDIMFDDLGIDELPD